MSLFNDVLCGNIKVELWQSYGITIDGLSLANTAGMIVVGSQKSARLGAGSAGEE